MMTEESKFELTSTAIKQATDGNYPYYQCSFLIPHEMLRREMHRLANAINNLDLAKSPWKIYCLKEWYQVFFMPVLEDHHHNEETIFFPHYKELGVETPANQTNAHDMLIKELTVVNEKIIELYDLVDNDRLNGGSAQNPLVEEKVKALQETYRSFHADTLIHLGEEETYWPQCVENYGEKEEKKVVDKIVNAGVKNGGFAFQLESCAICNAVGISIGKIPATREGEKGWASEEYCKAFIMNFPAPVRMLLLPGWNKKYQRYKTMILSCAGDTDILHVQDQQPGCQCTIM